MIKCCIFRLRQTKKRIIILDEAERIFIELDKKPAKTGDATSIASWISMMTVAGAMLLKRKKRS